MSLIDRFKRVFERPTASTDEWPAHLGDEAFRRRCTIALQQAGWRVSSGMRPADCRIDRGGSKFLVIFLAWESQAGTIQVQDWSELKTHSPLPLLILCYQPPSATFRQAQADRGNLVIDCRDLDRIEQFQEDLQSRMEEKFVSGTGGFTIDLLQTLATRATEKGEHAKAAELWKRIREAAPQNETAYIREAFAHIELKDFAEAEAIMARAIATFPASQACAAAHCYVAHLEGSDPERSLARWQALRVRFPGVVDGYLHPAKTLNDLGRIDAADALFTEAAERFPDARAVPFARTYALEARGELHRAHESWTALLRQDPDSTEAKAGVDRTLRLMAE
jgi:tetratricopeptide (TPR) repeat protein